MIAQLRRTSVYLAPVLQTLLLVLILAGLAAAAAENSVKSVRLVNHENFSRLVLAMEREPRFRVNHVDEHRLPLELGDVKWPRNQHLAEVMDGCVKKMATLGGDVEVNGLEITMARPFRNIRSSWRAGANELDLDIYLLAASEDYTDGMETTEPQPDRVITAVRLGTHPEFSRLVVELSEKTSYQLERTSAERLMLEVNGATLDENFTPTKLHDLRVLEMTTVSKDDENVSFLIELAAPAEKLEHFWWEEKNRLIVDIYGDIAKGERDQTEVSQPVAKNQEKKVSDSQGSQASAEPEKVDLPTATSALEDEARNTQSGSSIGQAVSSDDKDTEAKKTISVSPGLATLSGSQGGRSDSTPEAVLETLIPSLAPEAADLLRRILKATGENKADRAIELIAKYDEQYQGRAIEPLMLLRGDLYFQLGLQGVPGSFDEAVNAYRDSNALSGRSTLQPWVLLQLGRIQLRRKRYLEALGYLDLVINKHRSSPHKATALIHRGRLYLEKDRADLALDDFQQVLSECPESPHIDEALLGKAISLSLRGEHNQAEALFAEIEIRTPKFYLNHPEILYYWGRNDLILERFQRGREKFFLALNVGLQPQDTDLLLAHIGDSFRSQGEPDRAASYYRLSMKLFPGSDGAMVSRARLAEQSGDMELMAEIVREHPESEMAEFALLRMAAYFHEKGNDHEAIRMLEQLERGYPASSLKKESRRLLRRSLRKRVEQLRRQGDYWELLALLKTVKLWLAGMYRLKAGLWEAEAYVKLSLWDDAVAALTAIAPDDLDKEDRLQWTLLLGQAYESKGDLVLAESLLRGLASTVSGGKSAGEVKWQLARILQKAGNHEDGVAAYRELLNGELAGAARPKALMAMAKSLLALGQDREARDACQRVLSLLSEGDQEADLRAAAWADLGEIHYREGSFELAARAYEKALQYGENSAPAPAIHQRSRLASCYHKLGAPAKAQHLYQKIEREAGDLWRQMVSVSQRIQELQSKINEVEPPES